MNKNAKNESLIELSDEACVTIGGGESAWYWVAYGVGAVAREAKEAYQDTAVYLQKNIVDINPAI